LIKLVTILFESSEERQSVSLTGIIIIIIISSSSSSSGFRY